MIWWVFEKFLSEKTVYNFMKKPIDVSTIQGTCTPP